MEDQWAKERKKFGSQAVDFDQSRFNGEVQTRIKQEKMSSRSGESKTDFSCIGICIQK